MLSTRQNWITAISSITRIVFEKASTGTLRRDMPVECQPGTEQERKRFAHLEAVGRSLAGIAPWLDAQVEDAHEASLQKQFQDLVIQTLRETTDPASPDFLNFSHGRQPVVDAAFLAHAVLRAPLFLCRDLPDSIRDSLALQLRATRACLPHPNNWLLFSAMIEAALYRLTGEYDKMRVDYALRAHMIWYKGDGIYGDGENFHFDYYNSFVIQPMLLDIIDTLSGEESAWHAMKDIIHTRAMRYAVIQERLIGPDGSFPAIGRSLAYRFGVFQHLAQMALQKQLPDTLPPAQVRCALDATMQRILSHKGLFDESGWLQIGFCGHQPDIGETYISTGSLYLCATAFLPLGLPASDVFWSDPDQDWTGKRIWAGENVAADHALYP